MSGASPLVFYFFFGHLVGDVDSPDLEANIRKTAYIMLGVAGLSSACMWMTNAILNSTSERITNRIRRELFRALTRQDMTFFAQNSTATLMQRLTEDCQTVKDAFSTKVGSLFASVCQLGGGLALGFYYSWELTCVMIGSGVVVGFAIFGHSLLTNHYTSQTSRWSIRSSSISQEVITGFRTVKSFNGEQSENERYYDTQALYLHAAYQKALVLGLTQAIVTAAVWAACAGVFVFAGHLVSQGKLTLGKFVTAFGTTLISGLSLSQISTCITEMIGAKSVFRNIRRLIVTQPDINLAGGIVTETGTIQGDILFERVSFTYPGRDTPVLKKISFNITPGSTVAFVGESGSGKTTIFSLLERFYDATKGRVLIDGNNIKSLNQQWLHMQIALVSQEPILFSGTIEENIRYGRRSASMEEVIEAATKANAHNFIMELPDTYQTEVGERGASLSGGQKQRVAIARAILKDPKILLLDEATSALDDKSEKLVQAGLDELMKNRTTLVIAHRLATVQNAATIYLIDKGEILEQGTHQELWDAGQKYRQLCKLQFVEENERARTRRSHLGGEVAEGEEDSSDYTETDPSSMSEYSETEPSTSEYTEHDFRNSYNPKFIQ